MGLEPSMKGVGVAVTRGEGGVGPLSVALIERGATVLDWGCVGFAPPEDLCPLLGSLARIQEYDWICFSSPRAVEAVVQRVAAPPQGVRMAAVGPSTAADLELAGWPVHRVPSQGTGEGLVEAFRVAGDAAGARVLFPASAIAREVIPRGLSEMGARVDRVTAYRLVTFPVDPVSCAESVKAGEVQVVTFASPSAMEALREGIGQELFGRLAETIPAAVMGPTTAAALGKAGWTNLEEATVPTMDGLADAALRASTGGSTRVP